MHESQGSLLAPKTFSCLSLEMFLGDKSAGWSKELPEDTCLPGILSLRVRAFGFSRIA